MREARPRSLVWTVKTMKTICEAKLLQDAVDCCAGLPRSRFPPFVARWVGLHFGPSTFGEQQMVDLIEALETHREKSFLIHALHLCSCEQLNAGQTAALLNILDIIDVIYPARDNLHPTPYTLHPTPYTLHPTPYTLHPTPFTLHPAPYTLHPTPYTPHPAHISQSWVVAPPRS